MLTDLVVGADAEFGQHRSHQSPIIRGVHGDGIACLVRASGTSELHFVVPDLLVGIRRGEQLIDDDAGVELMMAFPALPLAVLGRRRGRGGLDHRAVTGQVGSQQLDDVGRPGCGGLFVEAVYVDAIGQPGGTKGFQPLVEEFACVAEEFVRGVAQREYREAQVLQPRGVVGAQRFPEKERVVRELALAERRADHDEVGRLLQLGEVDLVEFDCLGLDADGRRTLGECHGGIFGVAHVGAEGDDQGEFGPAGHERSPRVCAQGRPTRI
ncbi:MAG: hypothetical protein QOJ80_6460 [Mycobacterium sp.]|nr:hypothetical protein [Mycobacterium sp.]